MSSNAPGGKCTGRETSEAAAAAAAADAAAAAGEANPAFSFGSPIASRIGPGPRRVVSYESRSLGDPRKQCHDSN